MNFASINNFSLSGSSDWVLLLIFLAVAFVYGLSMGRNRLVAVMLGTYFAFIVTKWLPWKEFGIFGLKQAPSSNVQIFVFLALILGFFFLIPHSSFKALLKGRGRSRSGLWQTLMLSFLQIGLILAAVISFLPAKISGELSPLAQTIFVGEIAQFLWLLAPILALMFLKSPRGSYDVD